jgi:membrane protease YdiL (CAAX protease family)
VTLQPWRLATFFPGLLFGWLRARTGGVVAPAVAHALSNLLLLFLEASLAAQR